MDILSGNHLEKYESILNEINSEFEKNERLKQQINNENDEIIALKLVSFPTNKISYVNVKIFNCPSELLNLYCDELKHVDFNYLNKFSSYKFYLIEIFLPKSLLQKLLISKWKLQINIEANEYSTSKTCVLNNNSPTYDVIPIPGDIKECVVNTCLFLPSDENWTVIDLNSLQVDISYHFESHKEPKNKYKHLNESLFKLAKLYNNCDYLTQYNHYLEGVLPCHIATKELFIKTILQNCYHRFRLEIKENNEENFSFDLKFYIFNQGISVSFNPGQQMIQFKCAENVRHLVQIFFARFANFQPALVKDKLKKTVDKMNQTQSANPQEVLALYKETRKIWLQ